MPSRDPEGVVAGTIVARRAAITEGDYQLAKYLATSHSLNRRAQWRCPEVKNFSTCLVDTTAFAGC
jgi:hypothetical protein